MYTLYDCSQFPSQRHCLALGVGCGIQIEVVHWTLDWTRNDVGYFCLRQVQRLPANIAYWLIENVADVAEELPNVGEEADELT